MALLNLEHSLMPILQNTARGGVAMLILFSGCLHAQTHSSLVYSGPDGKLEYAGYANEGQTSTGNHMSRAEKKTPRWIM